jgi:hypothetical protein
VVFDATAFQRVPVQRRTVPDAPTAARVVARDAATVREVNVGQKQIAQLQSLHAPFDIEAADSQRGPRAVDGVP